MKIKGFLIIFPENFGTFHMRDGRQAKYTFNHKFFHLQEDAEKSLELSLAKAKNHGMKWEGAKIIRIECDGKEVA